MKKKYLNILIMDLCTCWGICFSCMLSGLAFFFNCKRILNQQIVLVIFLYINMFLFVHLLVNLLQMDDGLEFSFTDKRRFAKIRLLDNVIVYSDYWKSLLFYLLWCLICLITFVCSNSQKLPLQFLSLDLMPYLNQSSLMNLWSH